MNLQKSCEYKEEYIQEFIRLNPQLNEEMISVELDTYKDAAYELNKIFVETVGTIKKCDIDAINEAVDLFFDQDEPTDLIQIFVANTIQILNQPDLLVDVLGLSVLINEIIMLTIKCRASFLLDYPSIERRKKKIK